MAARGTKLGGAAAVVVLAAAGGVYLLQGDDRSAPDSSAEAYLTAWEDADLEAMKRLVVDPPETFDETHQQVLDNLGVEDAAYEVTGVSTDGDEAIATFSGRLTLGSLGDWAYEGSLRLRHTQPPDGGDSQWLVDWSPRAIHPQLRQGQRLNRVIERPARAPLLDAAGEPLVENVPGTVVGIQPSRVQDRQQVKDALATHLAIDPAVVDQRLDAPGVEPDHFVAITTIPNTQYEQVRPAIYPVPGTVFRDTTMRAAPSAGYAQHVIGRVGDITAERLEELGSPYEVGDVVGLSGLEARFERELAGTPSGEVRIEDADGEEVRMLARIEGTDPQPVRTTLDRNAQAAVEAALARVTQPAAAVVVDADGNVRAAASRPLNEDFNRALAGTYPPGSTFKVVTTSALLASGVTPESPIDCPETLNAGGRVFRNFEGGQLGQVPFATAFAESCNTAFINATADLPAADLVAAAERFGFNSEYSVGPATEASSFPEPSDATEQAAATIGQGRTLATPLHMATVAAAVIDGTWEPPTLLPDHPGENRPPPTELDPAQRETLANLMRRVVSEGSGTAAAVPGADIGGKTGTAEFGTGDPPPTHAWFIGFRGNHAVSLVIEDGGVGGRDAAPVARDILAALPD